jgi:SNF2 family DNA or RNA helicase
MLIHTKICKEGHSFYLNNNDNSLDISEWNRNIKSKGDTVAYQLLSQLTDDGNGQSLNDHFLIPHEVVATLPQDERDLLDLPEPFPFDIEISHLGSLTDPDFKYQYRYMNGGFKGFINPERIGSLLRISEKDNYTLVGNQYQVLEAIDNFNTVSSNEKNPRSNLLSFGEIKGLIGGIGFSLDTYLNNEEVVSPENICLRLNPLEDGSVEILPIFCDKVETDDGIKCNKNILDAEQTEGFYKTFKKLKEKDIYSIPNGPKVILSEQQKESLRKVKSHSKVDRDDRIILNKPQSFFDSEVIDFDTPLFEDGELITWSDRVIEIGEYRYKAIPFVRPTKDPWLPPEGGILLDDDCLIIPPEEREKVKKELEEAIKHKVHFIEYDGKKIPARPEVLDAINDLIKEYSNKAKTSNDESGKTDNKEDNTSKVLVIKDNIEEDEFGIAMQKRHGNPKIAIPLKTGKEFLDHQKTGVRWLQNCWINGYRGCLLADDMGLGKTLQALSFCDSCSSGFT